VFCLKSSYWTVVFVLNFAFSNLVELVHFLDLDTIRVVFSCILFMYEGFAFFFFQ
jgi:hypothetical protein